MKALAALALVMLGAGAAAAGCGDAAAACTVAGGAYHIALPGAPAGAPAVMFLHGAGGSGATVLRHAGMVAAMRARGYAVIAPDGMARAGRFGAGWSFHPGVPGARDEAAFLQAVAADAAGRFGIDRARVLLAGFSVGGSMTSYVACAVPGAFAAYAPVGGGFWRPHPGHCAGPVRLFHTHGWRDTTVPLEGRILGGGAIAQGDIFRGLEIWRAANGCTQMRPDGFRQTGPFLHRVWTACAPGSALEFALHPGAHAVPEGWAPMVLDWFEALD
ncbi:MAG: alpha/beta hydrolase family esterase [Gemmobacter sp.]